MGELVDNFLIEFCIFLVHNMIIKIFHSDRLKSACSNMQSNKCPINPLVINQLKDFISKMQSRCRRSDGSMLFCINSLITLSIRLTVVSGDLGGQRHMT